METFKVNGHVRSGNHALAALLHRAFFPALSGRKVINSGTGHWTDRKPAARYQVDGRPDVNPEVTIPYADILGDHRFPTPGGPLRIVYIIRDGRDVALSMFRWPKMAAPRGMSFNQWIHADIDWRGTPGHRTPTRHGYTVWHHWRDHVQAWAEEPGVLPVFYDDLVLAPHAVVKAVALHFDITPVDGWAPPGMTGWNAGKTPRVAAWKREMSEPDRDFFDSIVPYDFIGRGM